MDAVILFVIGMMILMLACFLAGFVLCAWLNNEAITGTPRRNFIRSLFGWCPHCGRWLCWGVKRRRQNTAYEDEESNYITVCRECFDEIQALWDERWIEYYSSRL